MVGTALGNKDGIIVFQGIDGFGTGGQQVQTAFISCKQNGEGGQRDLPGNDGCYFCKNLAVRDNKDWLLVQAWQGFRKFTFPNYNRNGAGFQEIPDSLLLRKDQSAFGSCFIDRDHKDDELKRFYQIRHDVAAIVFFWSQEGDGLF